MTNKRHPYYILFLHHSTGDVILHAGKMPSLFERKLLKHQSFVKDWFTNFNKANNTNYIFDDQYFPKSEPYGWNNYPYDYYNIWIKHAGNQYYKDEPTLEILTQKYNLIIFKHCYPVSDIEEGTNQPDIDSPVKCIENYKLQYEALKQKMKEFPQTKFLVWTGAARVASSTTKEQAERARIFFDWVKTDWNASGSNIFLFDFYSMETGDTLYLKEENARSPVNSHPGESFARRIAPVFCERIIEVIEQNK